jgi:hypothetical protein
MAKDKVILMGDGRYSYSFNNGNTNVFLSKKPNNKIKNELKMAFKDYKPSRNQKNLAKTFSKFKSLQNINQQDPKAPKKYIAFRSNQLNKKTGQKREVIVTTKGMFNG